MISRHVCCGLALTATIAVSGMTQTASAQPVPAMFDGKDTTYQIIPGSNLRSGDNFTSGVVVTLWKGGSIKGSGTCSQQSCPVIYNTQTLYARRTRLRLGSANAPSGPNGPAITETLRRGDQGDNIKRLQEALNRNGASITVDSNYGRGTKSAVEAFQKAKQLGADGVAGPATLRALGLA